MRPAVDAIARTRAAAKEVGSDDYSSLLYFFPFVCTPLVSLPFGAPNYDHQPAGPALSDNVCSNISSCKSDGSFVKRDTTSGKWRAQYGTSSRHSVLLGLYDTKEDALQKVQSVQGNSSSGLASAMNNSSSSNSSSSNISNSALPDGRYVQLSQPQRKAISVRTVRASLHLCPELF